MLTFSFFLLYSEGASDTDSEVEDRVDGVKSWLSKNKGSAKNLSDDGSLKSSSPPSSRRRFCLDRSDEEEEEEKEEGSTSRSTYRSRYKRSSYLNDSDGETTA